MPSRRACVAALVGVGWGATPSSAVLASGGDDSGTRPRATAAVLFVNFDGAVISGGLDDARTNTSSVAEQFGFTGSYPAYGGSDAQRESVLSALGSDWAPFGVEVVDARPGEGEYAMVVIGPLDHPFGMGINSAGPVDCWDENHNSVSFVFYGAEDLGGAAGTAVQATELSQEFAHAVGLEHVSGSGSDADIMYPTSMSPTAAFIDECFVLAGGATCGDMHAELSGCADAGSQNSFQELMGLFGPAQADDSAPGVSIVAPGDGEHFSIGEDIEVEVEATDDIGVVEVVLTVDGELLAPDAELPFVWTIVDAGEGEHTLSAVARDAGGNEAVTAPLTISVEAEGSGADPPASGCACAVRSSGPRSLSLLVPLLLVRARRRGRALRPQRG